MGFFMLPASRQRQIDLVADRAHVVTARFELLSISQALAEAKQYEATLGQIVELYKRYIVGVNAAQILREKWRDLPTGQRPRNRKVAKNRPNARREFFPLYEEAQALVRQLQAEGFDPLTWWQDHPGANHTLGGPDGVTYTRRAPEEKV